MEQILQKANELVESIKNSNFYKDYNLAKSKILQDQNLYQKIKAFKQLQFEYKMKPDPSFEEERAVSALYTELMLNEDAKLFLKNEMEIVKLLSQVFNLIGENCQIDLEL